MTKEQRDALDALITWFSPDACPDADVHAALATLRDAEPEKISCGDHAARRIRRLEQELENVKRSREAWRQMTDAWGEWAEQLCPEAGCDNAEKRAEISRLVEEGRKLVDLQVQGGEPVAEAYRQLRAWVDWSDKLTGKLRPMLEAQAIIARLVELGRSSEDRIAKLQERDEEWGSWAATLTDIEENDTEARDEIERLVELGRAVEASEHGGILALPRAGKVIPTKVELAPEITPPEGWEERLGSIHASWVSWAPIGNSEESLCYEDGILHARVADWRMPACLSLFRRRVEQLFGSKPGNVEAAR